MNKSVGDAHNRRVAFTQVSRSKKEELYDAFDVTYIEGLLLGPVFMSDRCSISGSRREIS